MAKTVEAPASETNGNGDRARIIFEFGGAFLRKMFAGGTLVPLLLGGGGLAAATRWAKGYHDAEINELKKSMAEVKAVQRAQGPQLLALMRHLGVRVRKDDEREFKELERQTTGDK